jgi:ATP-dependent DNA helicase RecQ
LINLQEILFFDLEMNKDNTVSDVGALFQGNDLHEKSMGGLVDWIKKSKYICGHNIIAHDIPIIKRLCGDELFDDKIIIDTLVWSPIVFGSLPYHPLVKEYKIVNELDVNNPLSDCKLTLSLLKDLIQGFHRLESQFQTIIFALLQENRRFNGFFSFFEMAKGKENVKDLLKSFTSNSICTSVDLDEIIKNNSVELIYSLAVILASNKDSIASPWVINEHPLVEELFTKLRLTECSSGLCAYCSENLNPVKALKTYFGYDEFRKFDEDEIMSLQERTVRAGLSSDSFVVVFPTGGGKSLTFQIPALMKGNLGRQLTVVISPLISLMKDQVDNLESKFHITKAVAINGLLDPLSRTEAIERVGDGRAHLLYISPESLRSKTIYNLIKNRSIARIVIDEAHCFSSWGQDFRVDYLFIGEFIKDIIKEKGGNVEIPISCFTATAKPQVIEDIKTYFKTRNNYDLKEYITRASRKNLQYEVIPVEDNLKKKNKLYELVEHCEKPAIVYASRTKTVEELASALSKLDNFSTTFFHGKLDNKEKVKNQNAFMSEESEVIVATSAFGMGVDKDNVKTVIHFDIADSLENYIQEAGRAGRSSNINAKCYILYREEDLNKHFTLLQQTKINIKEIKQIWGAIKDMCKSNQNLSNSALQFAKEAGWETDIRQLENKVSAAIAALEDQNFLKRKLNSPVLFANSLLIREVEKASEIIRNSPLEPEDRKTRAIRVLQRILKDKETRVDYLADVLGIHIKKASETIGDLKNLKILGNTKDLTAYVSVKRSSTSSKNILLRLLQIEKELFSVLTERKNKKSLKHLNQFILDKGTVKSTIDEILAVLDYWDLQGAISKRRIDRQSRVYEIEFKDRARLKQNLEVRDELAGHILSKLLEKYNQQIARGEKSDAAVEFSSLELFESVKPFVSFQIDAELVEKTLLYMHSIGAVELEGGFMVSYNKFNIEDIDKSKINFKKENYENLRVHYEHKIEQIHIVGKYASQRLFSYKSAMDYVNDYFTMDFPLFRAKYFKGKLKELARPMTDAKFKKIVNHLDPVQLGVVNDNAENILIQAGPGSGKTTVLVHKIANMLLMEDVKPEQFLMLTFSKAAAIEFKSRIRKIIPEYANLIEISTFHSFCFKLLGELGDLHKSENVIKKCLEGIKQEEIKLTSISKKNVLVLDEFQDVNADEYELIRVIQRVASNIRTVAVGDDDQNIYEFRGASNKYLQKFQEKEATNEHYLKTNYRSGGAIIDFNQNILNAITHRLKSFGTAPNDLNKKSWVNVTSYKSTFLEKPSVDAFLKLESLGSRAFLTRNNKEALHIHSLLVERGINAKLLAGFKGFRLGDLLEIKVFTNELHRFSSKTGFIETEVWERAIENLKSKFSGSRHLFYVLELIKMFHTAHASYKQLVEWREYINNINVEDALKVEKNSIVVSTMHKSKGKEFDHVFIMAQNQELNDDSERRLMYVACSRAKASLSIHTNLNFFKNIDGQGIETLQNDEEYTAPVSMQYVLGHDEINLNSVKYTQRQLKELSYHAELKFGLKKFDNGNEALGLFDQKGNNILLFSRKFNEITKPKFEKDGYKLTSAEIEYLVFWYDVKEEKEYLIVLPKITWEKMK